MCTIINLAFTRRHVINPDLMDLDFMTIPINCNENVVELLNTIKQYSPYYEIKVSTNDPQPTITSQIISPQRKFYRAKRN